MFLLIAGVLALGGGSRRWPAATCSAGYLQPSSLQTLGWLAEVRAWLRDGRS